MARELQAYGCDTCQTFVFRLLFRAMITFVIQFQLTDDSRRCFSEELRAHFGCDDSEALQLHHTEELRAHLARDCSARSAFPFCLSFVFYLLKLFRPFLTSFSLLLLVFVLLFFLSLKDYPLSLPLFCPEIAIYCVHWSLPLPYFTSAISQNLAVL